MAETFWQPVLTIGRPKNLKLFWSVYVECDPPPLLISGWSGFGLLGYFCLSRWSQICYSTVVQYPLKPQKKFDITAILLNRNGEIEIPLTIQLWNIHRGMTYSDRFSKWIISTMNDDKILVSNWHPIVSSHWNFRSPLSHAHPRRYKGSAFEASQGWIRHSDQMGGLETCKGLGYG